MSIKDFGGFGDGKTPNTETLQDRTYMQGFGDRGGSRLNVPLNIWDLRMNGPSCVHLPSYGREGERLGGRHISLIHGDGLTNVVITGMGRPSGIVFSKQCLSGYFSSEGTFACLAQDRRSSAGLLHKTKKNYGMNRDPIMTPCFALMGQYYKRRQIDANSRDSMSPIVQSEGKFC
ncbi:hypothetical protein Pint_27320 [Pistacia integerrima]|uniref:Uncharacterized protein n=1 Tax=Pistacia integerrima TaxID=434235 RepID=A0ACC0YT48_9ROSI|nr:hypothetical protein Pint_27320 [Pistacia integerrima]